MTPNLVLLVSAALSFTLLGLILTVQFVHYPAFGEVGPDTWARFHAQHGQRITWLVGPLMLAEAATAALLVMHRGGLPAWAAWASAALVVLIWLDTAFWAVPVHNKLSAGATPELVAELLRANWVRTVAWAARSALLAVFVARLLR